MNATIISRPPADATDLLAGNRVDVSLIAHLAFARNEQAPLEEGRHLALLPLDTLELDLTDPVQREFGDYELLELIGEGGMGVVYRARQISLDREVAIKLLAAGVWASAEFVERFRREAQNAARMQHPNIVPVYEVGENDELHFFSMRLIRGPSLASELRREKVIAPMRAAQLLRTIAEAVDYAHRLGVLHLDLKPANVLIDENGTPHVADFGLARRLDSALIADSDEVSGTPSYMAPEQASPRTQRITRATDIWGLGAIAYELVTGEPPFVGSSPQDTLKLVVEGSLRSPRRTTPSLPRDLEAVILKCMAYRVDERYASARDLADDLSRFIEGRAVRARPLNAGQRAWRWARREPKLAAMTLCAFVALLIGLAATTQQWRRADAGATAARENLWATRAQTAHAALAGGDGFRGLRALTANLAEMQAAGRTDGVAIERQRIGTILANAPGLLDLVRLPAGEQVTSIAIAPDAQHFAVATSNDDSRHVHQYEFDGLRETWSTPTDKYMLLQAYGDHGAPHSGLQYTADGRFLLASLVEQPVVPAPRYSDMLAFDTRDGRVLEPAGLPEQYADVVYDRTVTRALVRFRSDKSLRWPDSAQFYEVDGWHPIGPRHTHATLPADIWLPAPDGSAWLGSRDAARFGLYEVPSLKPRWQLQLPETSVVRAWQFSHDGAFLALGSVDGAVRLVDAAHGKAVALGSTSGVRVLRVEFSADDRTLAAIDESGQLWIWDVATRLLRAAPLNFVRTGSDASQIRFVGDTLFGGAIFNSGGAELAYATLAPRAPFNNEAVTGAVRLRGGQLGTPFDASASARLLVTAGGENLVEVWRLPSVPLLAARAAPLPPQVQTFDGKRLVAVDGDTVRVVDVATGAPLSPPLRHPERVRFAELSADGRALATIAGRTVRVIDPQTWQLRGTPILLPQTPLRVAFAQAAPVLVLTTMAYDGDVLHEQIHRIDLTQGVALGPDVRVESLYDLDLDAQGRYAIVQTWNSAAHTSAGPMRLALDSGAVACVPKIDEPWKSALAADGRSAWFAGATRGSPPTLRHWDLAGCRELALPEPIQVQENAVFAVRGDELVMHRGGNEALIRIGADGRRQAAVGDAIGDAMYDFALSADGARAAIATRNAINLLDARQGQRLSAPLTAPIAGDDGIAKLAFSPDGARLLARTINGRWLFWELPDANDDVAALTRLARVLDPNPADRLSQTDYEELRARLHAVTHSPAQAAPVPEMPVAFAPVAGAEVDPRFVTLDLAAAINVPLVGKTWPEPASGGDFPTLAPGAQRFLDVDYRVDGGVQLSGGGTALALAAELHRSAVVPVPDVAARRVHVLALMHIPMQRGVPPRPFAHVVLIGADGHETSLEIRTVRDIVGGNPNSGAASVRIAWMGADSSGVRGGWAALPGAHMHAVALDVPPGTGRIRGLRFDVTDGPMEAPLFFAATLERADAVGSDRAEASP